MGRLTEVDHERLAVFVPPFSGVLFDLVEEIIHREVEIVEDDLNRVALARNSAIRNTQEERAAKEGNIRALNEARVEVNRATNERNAAITELANRLGEIARYRDALRQIRRNVTRITSPIYPVANMRSDIVREIDRVL